MANTITNFLVGLGFDFDKKGADQIDSSIDGIKSSALQLGAVVAGAFGIKSLTADFAASNDTLGKFSDTLGVTANDVNAFGNAIEHEGGTLQGFMSQLQGIEELRAGLLQGDAEFIAIAGKAGIDTTELVEATNATDAYLTLADQFAAMTTQERLNAARALGLDEASIRLLSKGRDAVMQLVDVQRQLRPVTESMTRVSADFNDQTQDLFNNVGRVADKISVSLLPQVNSLITSTNEWFNANQDVIDQNMDEALDPVVENFSEIAAAGGLFAASGVLGTFSGLAKFVPIVGGSLAGIAGTLSTITGLGAAGATGFAIGNILNEYIPEDVKEDIGRTTARVFATFGSEEAQQALDIERVSLKQQGLEQPGVPIIDWNREQASEALGLDLPQFLFNPIGQQPEVDSNDPRSQILESMGVETQRNIGDVPPVELNDDVPINVIPRIGDIPQVELNVDDVPVFNDPVELNVDDVPVFNDMFSPVDTSPERIERIVTPSSETTRQGSNDKPIRVEATLNLDGQVIDQRIINVTDRQNQQALDDIQSTIRG